MNRIEDILAKVDRIQPLPDTVLKLVHVINDPDSSVSEIVESIRYDQAVTSQVLRLANSAYFAMSREVDSLDEALHRLGTLKVLQLVMAVHTNSLMSREQAGYGLPPGQLWQHSVGVAVTSSLLAERMTSPNRNLMFTAGLLHDIGKVILNEHVAREFSEIARLVHEEHISFPEAEYKVLGFSHDMIGGEVARKWQLPDPIILGIEHHHRPQAVEPANEVVDLLHIADCICLLMGVGLGKDGLAFRSDEEAMVRHGLHEPDLEMIGAQATVELKRISRLFGDSSVKTPSAALAEQET